jgi:hypothetical protein
MHVVCISVLMNYDCTTHSILPFITITTKFLSKHCITKRVLDTKMNGYHCFKKMLNFHFDLSLKLSQGEVHHFSREVKKLSVEVHSFMYA